MVTGSDFATINCFDSCKISDQSMRPDKSSLQVYLFTGRHEKFKIFPEDGVSASEKAVSLGFYASRAFTFHANKENDC